MDDIVFRMEWYFYSILAAAVLHIVEEYFFPGGFIDFQKRLFPSLAPFANKPAAVVFNGLMLVLTAVAVFFGESKLVFGMSVAALLGINGIVHVAATIKTTKYVPGIITSCALYIPLALLGFAQYEFTGKLTAANAGIAVLLGMAYHAVIPVYFLLMKAFSRKK